MSVLDNELHQKSVCPRCFEKWLTKEGTWKQEDNLTTSGEGS